MALHIRCKCIRASPTNTCAHQLLDCRSGRGTSPHPAFRGPPAPAHACSGAPAARALPRRPVSAPLGAANPQRRPQFLMSLRYVAPSMSCKPCMPCGPAASMHVRSWWYACSSFHAVLVAYSHKLGSGARAAHGLLGLGVTLSDLE
eukprot:364447-Chlamydomonas_euryale.AAC.24